MDKDTPLETDAALLAFVGDLFAPAIRRQCWLLPMDLGDRVVVPIAIDDVPVDADPDHIAGFARMLQTVVDQTGAESIAVLWERPGGPDLQMQEADWAAALAASGAPLRAQILLHDDGARLIDPEFDALVA